MEKRIKLSVNNHQKGYNCSQAVLCAYHDLIGLEERQAFKIAEGFGSGMGGLRHTCGAVTAMFMVASYFSSDGDTIQNDSRKSFYQSIHDLAKKFEVKNSSLLCDQLLNCKHHQRYEKLCTSYVDDAVILLEEWRSEKA